MKKAIKYYLWNYFGHKFNYEFDRPTLIVVVVFYLLFSNIKLTGVK